MTRLSAKQYGNRTTLAMAIYVGLMLLVWPQVRALDDAAAKSLLALVPVLPMLYVIWLMARRILGSDELEQRTHLIGLGAATGASAVFALVCGFLAAARLFSLDAVAMLLFWVFPLQMLAYGGVRAWVARRYGSDALCEEEGAPAPRLAIAGVLLAIPAIWGYWRGKDAFAVGLLAGMAAALLLGAAILQWRRWRRARAADR